MPSSQEKPQLVLASGSPRRKDLLERILGTNFLVAPQDTDETPLRREKTRDYVRRVTLEKAASARHTHAHKPILAMDTIVALGRRMLRKAKDRDEAKAQMHLLSGRRHRVITGVVLDLPDKKPALRLVETVVSVKRLTTQDIDLFLESEDWKGVAVYRIQGIFGQYIKWLHGTPSCIMGLPLYEVRTLLAGNMLL